jgi:hypothetical protein
MSRRLDRNSDADRAFPRCDSWPTICVTSGRLARGHRQSAGSSTQRTLRTYGQLVPAGRILLMNTLSLNSAPLPDGRYTT